MTFPLLSLVFGAFDDPPGRGQRDERAGGRRGRQSDQQGDPQFSKPISASDAELVQRIRDGEIAAFEQLYESTFEALWQFAATLFKGEAGAEDTVQDVFLDLWRRRETWVVGESVRGYLFGAVRHRVGTLRHRIAIGHQAILHTTENDAPGTAGASSGAGITPSAEMAVEEHDMATRIRRVIDGLPERQRAAVLLRWLGDFTAAEIGRQLGVSDTAVRKLLLKAEKRLRIQLDEFLG